MLGFTQGQNFLLPEFLATLVITEKPFEMSLFQCSPCAAWAFGKLSEAYHLSLSIDIYLYSLFSQVLQKAYSKNLTTS